jgi:hypothetical protein
VRQYEERYRTRHGVGMKHLRDALDALDRHYQMPLTHKGLTVGTLVAIIPLRCHLHVRHPCSQLSGHTARRLRTSGSAPAQPIAAGTDGLINPIRQRGACASGQWGRQVEREAPPALC